MRSWFLLFILIIGIHSATSVAGVSVTSYNMGQLSKRGVDFVACTRKRVQPQVEAIFYNPDSPIYKEGKFVLMLQEVWTKRAFKGLLQEARARGLTIFPDNYKDVRSNGQISITNMRPVEKRFVPFSSDSHAKKGMVFMKLDLGNGKTLGALNVHTGYSTFKSFGDNHRMHFAEVGVFMEQEKRKNDHFIVGGDFNAGPDVAFRRQRYEASKVIWQEGFMPFAEKNAMRLLDFEKKTWDSCENMLVAKPTFAIKFINFIDRQRGSWDQEKSTIDHILVSANTEVTDKEVVFDEKVPLRCKGRTDAEGKMHLSDHYGVNASLAI